jgi:hypothetical protein
MATQELEGIPLGMIARQIRRNKLRGDLFGYNGNMWTVYGTSIDSYEDSFQGILNGRHIKDLLKDKEDPVVIDLMAPSGTLVNLFRQLQNKKSLGLAVTLEDLRDDDEKERDAKLNIIQISADILKPSTWKTIEKQLQGRKADLIMTRPVAGYKCIPRDQRLYSVFLNKTWGHLRLDGGIIMAVIPLGLESQAKKMLNEFEKGSKIGVIMGASDDYYCSMMIGRTPDSPEKLPFPKMR